MSAVKNEMIQKWETKVSKLSKETGYDFDFLWSIWTEMLQEDDPIHKTDEEKWEHFMGVSHEHDW